MRILTTITVILAASLLAACETTPKNTDAADTAASQSVQQNNEQASQSQLHFILAQLKEDKGLGELKLPDGSLWYLPRPVFTQADLIKAESMKDSSDKPFVRFSLNQAGTQRLTTISERFPGKFIVLTLDNSLQAIYRINGAITDGKLDIAMQSSEQANKVIESLPLQK